MAVLGLNEFKNIIIFYNRYKQFQYTDYTLTCMMVLVFWQYTVKIEDILCGERQ